MGIPSRVCSTAQCCAALTNSAVWRASRFTVSPEAPAAPFDCVTPRKSEGRAKPPMPFGKFFEASSGEKVPFGVCSFAFCSQTVSSCATFSSRVIRASRSSTRFSTGWRGSL
jgi:hypothetical protein